MMDAHGLAATELLPADRHPAAVYIQSLGLGSRRVMRTALDTIASILTNGQQDAEGLAWQAVRYQHVQAVRSKLAETYQPATTNRHVAALRGVLREAWRLGLVDGEAYQKAIDVHVVKAETLPRGRALSAGEMTALLRVCAEDPSPSGARDAALIAMLYGAGLRRSEAIGLNLDDYDRETGALTVRQSKGRKDRIVYLGANGAHLAMADWLAVRGDAAGPLLWAVNRWGGLRPGRISGEAVYGVLHRRCAEAGIKTASPHDLRRSFVSDLLDAGADLSIVQQLAGHAQPSTTARYDRRGEAAKKVAADRLHLPYLGRTQPPQAVPEPSHSRAAPAPPATSRR